MREAAEEIRRTMRHIERQIKKLEEEAESLDVRIVAIRNEYLPKERNLLYQYGRILEVMEEWSEERKIEQ